MAGNQDYEQFRAPRACYPFLAAAFVSVTGGFVTGFWIWLMAGYSPDNSGGTLIFVFGSCAMSLLSLVLAGFWRNKAVFYGLNFFTFLTISIVILSISR